MTELTINELMLLSMKRKGLKQKEVADKLGENEMFVSRLLNADNPCIESIERFFQVLEYPYDVIHKGRLFCSDSVTLWKLQQSAPGFIFRFSDGKEYRVSEVKPPFKKPSISL